MEIIREPRVTLVARPQFLEPEHLRVRWLGDASDGERLAEYAGRLCYMSQQNPAGRSTAEYLRNILKQGHGSVFEHAVYGVLIEGISRSCSHELVRHRAGWGYCLAGDTLLYSEHRWGGQRNGTKKRTIEQIYRMTLTPRGRSRLRLLRLRCLDEASGTFTTGRIAAVARTGVRPVFRVELEDGKAITCSRDHRFLMPEGWRPLAEIVGGLEVSPAGVAVCGTLGGEVLINGQPAYRDREWLRARYHDEGLQQHEIAALAGVSGATIRAWVRRYRLQKPLGSWTLGREPWNKGRRYRAGWAHSEETRRRLSEAKRGPGNPQWRGGVTRRAVSLRQEAHRRRPEVLARGGYRCRLCGARSNELTLHHILPIWARPDLSADPGNLAAVCRPCHLSINGREVDYVEQLGRLRGEVPAATPRATGGGQLLLPKARRIRRVVYVGERETYDLEMEGPNHNFVANGIVTHNSQLSQRYVDESAAAFVVPPAILGDAELEAAWTEQVRAAQAAYVAAVERLMARYESVADRVHRRKMAREAARSVLPNATEVKIVASANVRAWRTMLELRLGEGAELEIRRMAVACLRVLQREAPALFADFEIYRAADGSEAGRVGFHKV
jgi:thymidylate synthase (FAD)